LARGNIIRRTVLSSGILKALLGIYSAPRADEEFTGIPFNFNQEFLVDVKEYLLLYYMLNLIN
jgi:hypothetical protein